MRLILTSAVVLLCDVNGADIHGRLWDDVRISCLLLTICIHTRPKIIFILFFNTGEEKIFWCDFDVFRFLSVFLTKDFDVLKSDHSSSSCTSSGYCSQI